MTFHGHFLKIDPDECRRLLGGSGVGRVAWDSRDGLQILPVSYVFDDATIVFRASAGSVLSELVRPSEVAFQVDDLDVAQARVEALGGRLVEVMHARPGEIHLRMADPEGNEFTLVLPPTAELIRRTYGSKGAPR